MFNVGDYIVYGVNGVCKVEEIGSLNSGNLPKDRVYYTLLPVYLKGSKIFTPADNKKVLMRPVLNKDEAMELIDDIRNIDALWITDEKKRENDYRDALKKCDCKELVRIIKTIYSRKQGRIAEGKKMTMGDEKYFHMAEESLYGELAIPLNMDKEEVKYFITDRVDNLCVSV